MPIYYLNIVPENKKKCRHFNDLYHLTGQIYNKQRFFGELMLKFFNDTCANKNISYNKGVQIRKGVLQ